MHQENSKYHVAPCDRGEPRASINGSMLPKFKGKKITMIGRIAQISNVNSFTMTACDDVLVTVRANDNLQGLSIGTLIQVEGEAVSPKAVQASHYFTFPPELADNFSLRTYNEAIIVTISTAHRANPWYPG